MTPDQEPPPPEEEYAAEVVDFGAICLPGITKSLHSIASLLEHETYRGWLTGSTDPLRWNESAMVVTQGGETLELKTFITTIRREAESRFKVPTSKVGSFKSLAFSKEDTADAVLQVARKNSYDPVKEYLEGLRNWPIHGGPIDYVARDGLHLTDPLDLRIIKKWAISAVARAMRPGCKVDTVLILVGEQALGKSSFFSALAGEWFSDTPMDMQNKDRFQQLHGPWIYEWSELSSIRAADMEDIKAFITSQDDRFRASYAAETLNHKRHGVIVGSTNKHEFLRDPTGNRRFWPITLTERVDLDLIRSERDNFWAEALAELDAGVPWHDDHGAAEAIELAKRHEQHRERDAWEEPVGGWAKSTEEPVTVRSCLVGPIHMELARITRADQMRMASVLAGLGYQKSRTIIEGKREYVWTKSPT
jgi:putative DNA primase/helicase